MFDPDPVSVGRPRPSFTCFYTFVSSFFFIYPLHRLVSGTEHTSSNSVQAWRRKLPKTGKVAETCFYRTVPHLIFFFQSRCYSSIFLVFLDQYSSFAFDVFFIFSIVFIIYSSLSVFTFSSVASGDAILCCFYPDCSFVPDDKDLLFEIAPLSVLISFTSLIVIFMCIGFLVTELLILLFRLASVFRYVLPCNFLLYAFSVASGRILYCI